MNKKQTFLISVLLLITVTLLVGSVYEYKHHQNVTTAAVVKAQNQTKTITTDLSAVKLNLQAANGQVSDLTNIKIQLCAQLVKAKLTSPLCQ